MADSNLSASRVAFQGLEGTKIYLGREHVTRPNLQRLFQVDQVILIEQATPDDIVVIPIDDYFDPFALDADLVYLVAGEEFISDSCSDDGETAGGGHGLNADGTQKAGVAVTLQQHLTSMNTERLALIREIYTPLHPDIYEWSPEYLDDGLRAALDDGTEDAIMALLKPETADTRLYSFAMLKDDFCERLVEELLHFEASGAPAVRPNSMNNYGLVLDEIGFFDLAAAIMEHVVTPMARFLYLDYGGDSLDTHHAFIVQYRTDEDTSLDFHYDESEVTLNVCLGREFTGGTLFFRGHLLDTETHDENFEFVHVRGRGLLHIGKHRHGANAILSGERYNLILWCRSSTVRAVAHDAAMAAAMAAESHGHNHSHDHSAGECGHSHDHEHNHGDGDGDDDGHWQVVEHESAIDAHHGHSHSHGHDHSH